MCDYSLHSVKTRPAELGEKLTTHLFESGTKGFCGREDRTVAVCLLAGTELSFTEYVRRDRLWLWSKTGSSTPLRSFARSIKTTRPPITTPLSFQMERSFF
jgi:hypothetical protein